MSTETTPRLPDFTGKRCEILVICGYIKVGPKVQLSGFTKEDHWDYAEYKRGSKTVRVVVGRNIPRSKRGAHFHIDLTTSRWEAVGRTSPKKVLKRDQLIAVLTPLLGYEYGAKVSGYFTARRDELPAVIRYAMAPAHADGVELEMTSGRYTVRGAPIFAIRWTPAEEPDEYSVILEAMVGNPLGPTYLEDVLALIEQAFGALFRKEQEDG